MREKNLAEIPGMISAIQRGIRARQNKIQKDIATDRNPRTSQAIAEISKNAPKMLGAPIMTTATEKSKFKSAFGEPTPVLKPARRIRKPNMRRKTNPMCFFDSQRGGDRVVILDNADDNPESHFGEQPFQLTQDQLDNEPLNL